MVLALELQAVVKFCCDSDTDDNEDLGFSILLSVGADAASDFTCKYSHNSLSLGPWLHR